MRAGRRLIPAGGGFALFFALLLLPFPWAGELPGNCDTWLNGIALPNLMSNQLVAAVTGEDVGTPLYPETSVFGFGESAFGTSAIFIGLRAISGDDILAYYAFLVVVLTLNSLGMYLLAGHYVRDRGVAFVAGLAFSASNFTIGNLDSPHTSFFFLAFASLAAWKRFLATGERRALLTAVVLGSVQVYFSAYIFLFLWITVAGLLLSFGWRGQGRAAFASVGARTVIGAALLWVGVSVPFFASYAGSHASENFVNPWEATFLAEVHSLEPADLVRTLDDNLLYAFTPPVLAADIGSRAQAMIDRGVLLMEDLAAPDLRTVLQTASPPEDVKFFTQTRRAAFLGFVLYGLAVFGVLSARRHRWELVSIFFGGLILALGPMIEVGDRLYPNVTLPAYQWVDLARVLRVPSRAFSFSVLAVVLAAAIGLETLLGRRFLRSASRRWAVLILACGSILVENVPMPLASFAGTQIATPEPAVSAFFADETGRVLLDLPSRIGGGLRGDSQDLFEWNRELVYMNRQTYHRQNIVNGVHGYFPRTRIETQRIIDRLPAETALTELGELGVEFIVYHRALELPWEQGQYEALARSPHLEPVVADQDVTIFRLH